MSSTDIEGGGLAVSRRDPGDPVLLIRAGGLAVARQIGPLPWTALQHLALASRPTDDGWAAATGVRDIACGIGVTKDTAARAVSTLISAGLLTRGPVESTSGRRRCGYLLRLPESVTLQHGREQQREPRPDPSGVPGRCRPSWDQPALFATPSPRPGVAS